MRKKGVAPKLKNRYRVWGRVAHSDITFNEEVEAYSEPQAKFVTAARVRRDHPRMEVFLEFRGCTIISPTRPKISGMIPETDSSYPCNEGCGGGPEPALPHQKTPIFRRSVRDCNQRLF